MRGDDDGREIGCDLKVRRDASTVIDAIYIYPSRIYIYIYIYIYGD